LPWHRIAALPGRAGRHSHRFPKGEGGNDPPGLVGDDDPFAERETAFDHGSGRQIARGAKGRFAAAESSGSF